MVDIKKKITILLSIGIFCLISWNIHPLDINGGGGGDSQDFDVRVGNLRQNQNNVFKKQNLLMLSTGHEEMNVL